MKIGNAATMVIETTHFIFPGYGGEEEEEEAGRGLNFRGVQDTVRRPS